MVERRLYVVHRRGGRGKLLEKENSAEDGTDRQVEPYVRSGTVVPWPVIGHLGAPRYCMQSASF